MLGPSLASSEKVTNLNFSRGSAGRYVGLVQDEDTASVVAAENPAARNLGDDAQLGPLFRKAARALPCDHFAQSACSYLAPADAVVRKPLPPPRGAGPGGRPTSRRARRRTSCANHLNCGTVGTLMRGCGSGATLL